MTFTLPGSTKEPGTPKTPEVAKEPAAPVRQHPGQADVFRLPIFISDADKRNFYFRWPRENEWYKLQNAGYEKVTDPDTEQVVRIPTKDSDGDHILVRLKMEFRKEDLQYKHDMSNETKETPDIKIKGAALHELEESQ